MSEQVTAVDYQTLSTTSNAIQLAVNITRNVEGNAVADGINGEPLDGPTLARIFAAKLNNYIKGAE